MEQKHPGTAPSLDHAAESTAGGMSLHDTQALPGAPEKFCCECGRSVSGQKRYKDGRGRYWCIDCGDADTARKHPVPCPDCKRDLPRTEMQEIDNLQVCPDCAEKRRKAHKREAARRAAAEEAAREAELRRRHLILAATLVGVALTMYILYRVLVALWFPADVS